MTKNRDLKALVRDRMEKTGERYAAARRQVEGPEPSPRPLKGWRAEWVPEDYELVRADEGRPRSVLVRSRRDEAQTSSAMLAQRFIADDFRGSRVRLAGSLRCAGVTGSCALSMRIDENTSLLIFATSMVLRGDSDWVRREVVLDVDPEATLVTIALELHGAGSAWLADVAVEVVGHDVPLTATRRIPAQPQNLDFSE